MLPDLYLPKVVQIASDQLVARLHRPDPLDGFYKGTRFDWSGVVAGVCYKGHQYYAPWYTKRVPTLFDYTDDGLDISAGRQSAITGPAEEFPRPQGFETAQAGETFIKVGVGVLQKPADRAYSCYESYEIVDPGTWSVSTSESSVEFTHQLSDARTGCAYFYRKVISVTSGRAELVIEHALHNTGRVAIKTEQYNHNFLTLDGAPVGPDWVIRLPFRIGAMSVPDSSLAVARENEIRFRKVLAPGDIVSFPVSGFGKAAADYDIRIDNQKTGAGLRITGTQPLTKLVLWSIRSVLSMEPFIDVSTEPGAHTMWRYNYTHYVVDA